MRPDPPPIRAARVAAGYDSVAGAARAVGMRPNHLTRLETGRRNPSWATVSRLIAGLGLPLEFFHDPAAIVGAAERIRLARKGDRP